MATTLDDNGQRIQEAVARADAALRRMDLAGARAIARQALDAGLEHAFLIRVEALWLQQAGQLQEALRTYHHARTLDPQDPMILNGIAGVLAAMGQPGAALKILEASVALAPQLATTHYLQAWILETTQDYGGARAAYEQALGLDPRNADALAGLASSCAKLKDHAATREAAQKALAIAPGHPTATVALALADVAQGKPRDAEARLKPLLASPPSPQAKAVATRVLGDALDSQDRIAEAYRAYASANTQLKAIQVRPGEPSPVQVLASLAGLAENLRALPGGWPAPTEAPAGAARQHVFLVGFVRSGATRVEQALAAHPDVADLSGVDLLGEAANSYLTSADGIARLLAATQGELNAVRDAYWQGVAQKGVAAEGQVLVDKLAFNTIKLPLIARLFPQARILFLLRDPRDVALSCLREPVDMRGLAASFLDVEAAARLYDAVMTVGAWSLEKLPLEFRQLRYESLAQDFEGQMKAVCDFVGLSWNAAVAGSAAKSGRWRAYADELAPILPILAPWVEKFGYS